MYNCMSDPRCRWHPTRNPWEETAASPLQAAGALSFYPSNALLERLGRAVYHFLNRCNDSSIRQTMSGERGFTMLRRSNRPLATHGWPPPSVRPADPKHTNAYPYPFYNSRKSARTRDRGVSWTVGEHGDSHVIAWQATVGSVDDEVHRMSPCDGVCTRTAHLRPYGSMHKVQTHLGLSP
jgi:hypothetical protein